MLDAKVVLGAVWFAQNRVSQGCGVERDKSSDLWMFTGVGNGCPLASTIQCSSWLSGSSPAWGKWNILGLYGTWGGGLPSGLADFLCSLVGFGCLLNLRNKLAF